MPAGYLAKTRPELEAFLRQRRAQLEPESFGFEIRPNRRIKGLRREEVAAVAGVGLTWYTWFEQGRDIKVSAAFLDNVARGLRLNSSERAYLYFLADQAFEARPADGGPAEIEPSLIRLTDSLGLQPAYLKNFLWDIVHWNSAASFVFGDFADVPLEDRNVALLTFTESRFRGSMIDWEADAMRLVARLRADFARSAGDRRFSALIDRLSTQSEDFRLLWGKHAVLETGAGTRHIQVRDVGPTSFDYTVCRIGEPDRMKLVIYSARPGERNGDVFEHECRAWMKMQSGRASPRAAQDGPVRT